LTHNHAADFRKRVVAEHLDRHEHRHLAAGYDHDEIGRHIGAEAAVQILRHGLAQGRDPCRIGIAMLAVPQSLDSGLDNMRRGCEIGLADAQIDDVAALALQFRRPRQHSEGVFLADAIKGDLDGGHSSSCLRRWTLLLAKRRGGSKAVGRAIVTGAPDGCLALPRLVTAVHQAGPCGRNLIWPKRLAAA
jgi:hypothetical protein